MDQKTNLTIKPSLTVFICILADTHLSVLGSRLLDTGLLKKIDLHCKFKVKDTC